MSVVEPAATFLRYKFLVCISILSTKITLIYYINIYLYINIYIYIYINHAIYQKTTTFLLRAFY